MSSILTNNCVFFFSNFQSYTTAFKETQEPGVLDIGDDELFADIGNGDDDDMEGIGGLGDIFDGWGDGKSYFFLTDCL